MSNSHNSSPVTVGSTWVAVPRWKPGGNYSDPQVKTRWIPGRAHIRPDVAARSWLQRCHDVGHLRACNQSELYEHLLILISILTYHD